MVNNLTEQRLAELAVAASTEISAAGASPLKETIARLRRRGLTGSQAACVLAYGMAHRLIYLDRDATLRAPRREGLRLVCAARSAAAQLAFSVRAALGRARTRIPAPR